jgi:hypothetical protein
MSEAPNSDLIFHGQMLNENYPIGFYNVQQNDSVIALPRGCPSAAVPWFGLTNEFDKFVGKMRALMNHGTRNELIRLHDVHSSRLEMRPRSWRRLRREMREREKANGAEDGRVIRAGSEATSIPAVATSVSDTPLPTWWCAGEP